MTMQTREKHAEKKVAMRKVRGFTAGPGGGEKRGTS